MPATPFTTSRVIAAGNARELEGWSLAETTGAATARVRIIDGADATGSLIASINLGANESVRDWLLPQALGIASGSLYLQVVSGSVEGAVWWA